MNRSNRDVYAICNIGSLPAHLFNFGSRNCGSETDLRLGYTRAFERIGEFLKNAGASWDDVVEITSFHTDLRTQMPAMVAVKKNYVKPPFPAWTAIQASLLIPTNGITEIKVVAKLRK